MLNVQKEKDTIKLNQLLKLYSGIKTEIETVFITSSGNKFVNAMDAISSEAQGQEARKIQQNRREKIMGIMEVILKVLEEENWGFFYKNEPMRSLNTKDGGMFYEVNSVDLDEIERVLLNKLQSIKEGNNECLKEHTTNHSQQEKDLRQREN